MMKVIISLICGAIVMYFLTGMAYYSGVNNGRKEVVLEARQELLGCKPMYPCTVRSLDMVLYPALRNKMAGR